MNISQVLKSVESMWSAGHWAVPALRKYVITELDVAAYFFSSDAGPEGTSDREDDLFILTPEFLTLYRLTTRGISQDRIEHQRLEKATLPIEQISGVYLSWESMRPFGGEAPPLDQRSVRAQFVLDVELPPFGDRFELPYRSDEAEREQDLVSHQVETFAEAVLLQMREARHPFPLESEEHLEPAPATRVDPWGPGVPETPRY